MKHYFNEVFTYWVCDDNNEVNVVAITSQGLDLTDMLANAEIYFEDGYGNTTRENWTVGDLASRDYDRVVQLFSEHLAMVA